VNNQRILSSTLQQYALDNDKGADTWDDIVGEDKVIKTMPACPLGGTYNAAAQEDGTYEVTCTIPGHDPASLPARPSPR
jgi:hypothetical protein